MKRKSEDNGRESQKNLKCEDDVACVHEVSYPEGYGGDGEPRVACSPAKVFPFPLDPFQSEAIKCVEQGHSVMVLEHFERVSYF